MFIRFVLGVLAATYGFYQLPELPELSDKLSIILVVATSLLLFLRLFWRLVFPLSVRLESLQALMDFISGLIIGGHLVFLQNFLHPSIPLTLLNQPIELIGQIEGLVIEEQNQQFSRLGQQKWRFDMRIRAIQTEGMVKETFGFGQQPKVRLSWYQTLADANRGFKQSIPQAGEVWQLTVKLMPNHASLNPGSFDYETYLFQEGIQATGYVLNAQNQPNERLAMGAFEWRTEVTNDLIKLFETSDFKGIFLALLVGQKSDINPEDWETLQTTGTIHLMAISGLHMGIMAAIGYFLFGSLWAFAVRGVAWLPKLSGTRVKSFILDLPKIWVAGFGALLFSSVYLTLAGYAIPTQRAWLMVLVVLLMLGLQRAFQPFSTLALAALLIVIWQPTSVLSPGFWLSFVAVGLIFGALAHPSLRAARKWQVFWLVQGVLFIGLVPLIAFYYQQFPLMSLLANWIAVPFVSFFGLPVLLLLAILDGILPASWMAVLVSWNDVIWQQLWNFLKLLTESPINLIMLNLSLWQVLVFYAGLAVLALPRFIPLKHSVWRMLIVAGVLISLGLGFRQKDSQNVTVAVLDVGQAQAVVMLTPNHTLVIDTGARWSDKLDGASMAILPYLKNQQRTQIDLLVVSHNDIDHMGGAARLLKVLPVTESIAGQATSINQVLNTAVFKTCTAGQAWQFDQLKLEILAPLQNSSLWPAPKNDNDHSCVLKATFASDQGEDSILITGDLSQAYEKRLVKFYTDTDTLNASLLVAGHHGSKTASSAQFLAAVNPTTVIFSSGYHNRFGFPHPQVVQTVLQQGAQWMNTACSSAIIITAQPNHPLQLESFREQTAKWYHHRCLDKEQGRFYP